ncbi:hypothetical protein DIPPA_30893 [Diplonema papillatum]|nr:hypothetical protein DIPPA_23235 [Diplonema papillatum]KAJ9447750.1 hypothetical protein DIPPA_30893 [Diplonema papillatum]
MHHPSDACDRVQRQCEEEFAAWPAVVKAAGLLRSALGEKGDGSHGLEHALIVARHAKRALESETDGPVDNSGEDVLLAALLHDADDVKLFGAGSTNVAMILSALSCPPPRRQAIEDMISLVSTRNNHNRTVPEGDKWKLVPRDCDRLEAVGRRGLVRCYQYNKEVGAPVFTERTPRAATEEELFAIATPERFAAYNGGSDSMVDHCYDKLLHVCTPASGNEHLAQRFDEERQAVIDFCLEFGRTGKVDTAALEEAVM